MKKLILTIFSILAVALVVALTIHLCSIYVEEQEKVWNNGYCIKCGTPYQAISYWKGSTRYECPNCHFAMWK